MAASDRDSTPPAAVGFPAVAATDAEKEEGARDDYLIGSPKYRALTLVELENDPSIFVVLLDEAQILALPAPHNVTSTRRWWTSSEHGVGQALVPQPGGRTLSDRRR